MPRIFRGNVAAAFCSRLSRDEASVTNDASETNPLREAALSQKKGRVAATRFVSRKN